ncbi:MAG TPA: ATP-binding protein, partial [Algoriphagus sp.]
MISVKNLKKQYKEAVVLDVETLDISTSECFGLVGNNGAGKTTLFRIMLDLVRPTDGTVIINGHQVNQDEEWKKFTGAYLDEHMLLAYL